MADKQWESLPKHLVTSEDIMKWINKAFIRDETKIKTRKFGIVTFRAIGSPHYEDNNPQLEITDSNGIIHNPRWGSVLGFSRHTSRLVR